jgi:hypothetical protein
MDNNLAISQIPICTRIYEYFNWKDKLEFKKICKGVYNNIPKIRYRVINILSKFTELNRSRRDLVIFIESNTHNDPHINRCVEVIEYLTNDKQNLTKIDFEHIYMFFNNPLSKVFKMGSDNDKLIYILFGEFWFDVNFPTYQTDNRKYLIDQWRSETRGSGSGCPENWLWHCCEDFIKIGSCESLHDRFS